MSKSTRSMASKWLGQARWGLTLGILIAILLLISGAETGLFGTTTLAKVQDVGFIKAFTPPIIP